MPDITASVGSTWQFGQNLAGCRAPLDLDVSDDYLLFDNQVEADYTQEVRALGRDARMGVTSSRTVRLCHARLYVIGLRDLLLQANGHLRVGDVRAEVSVKELDGLVPGTGDKLVSSGTYFVFGADYDHTAQMYIVWCRK